MYILFYSALVVGFIVFLAAIAHDTNTYFDHQMGQASPMEVRESRRGLVKVMVTVVIALAGTALALHVAFDFFSSNTPQGEAGQSEEATTAPATSEPTQDDK